MLSKEETKTTTSGALTVSNLRCWGVGTLVGIEQDRGSVVNVAVRGVQSPDGGISRNTKFDQAFDCSVIDCRGSCSSQRRECRCLVISRVHTVPCDAAGRSGSTTRPRVRRRGDANLERCGPHPEPVDHDQYRKTANETAQPPGIDSCSISKSQVNDSSAI